MMHYAGRNFPGKESIRSVIIDQLCPPLGIHFAFSDPQWFIQHLEQFKDQAFCVKIKEQLGFSDAKKLFLSPIKPVLRERKQWLRRCDESKKIKLTRTLSKNISQTPMEPARKKPKSTANVLPPKIIKKKSIKVKINAL
jgi:hypothetical protein